MPTSQAATLPATAPAPTLNSIFSQTNISFLNSYLKGRERELLLPSAGRLPDAQMPGSGPGQAKSLELHPDFPGG